MDNSPAPEQRPNSSPPIPSPSPPIPSPIPSVEPLPPVQPVPGAPGTASPDGTMGGLIPYKNSSALIAYYLGVFSLIPCPGPLFGIPALILGIIGLKYYYANPAVKGRAHALVGIIIGGIWIVLVVIGMFAILLNSGTS